MSNKDCGNCDYQGGVTRESAECLIDEKLHPRGYICQDFKDYVYGKNLDVKLTQALEKKREREASTSEQRERAFVERMAQQDREHDAKLQQESMRFERKQRRKSFWGQIVLLVLGTLLGIAGTLIVQALTKK